MSSAAMRYRERRYWQGVLQAPGASVSRDAVSNGSLLLVNPKVLASLRAGAGQPVALLINLIVNQTRIPCAITCTAWPSRSQGERMVRNEAASAVVASAQPLVSKSARSYGNGLPYDTIAHSPTDCAVMPLDILDAPAAVVELEPPAWSASASATTGPWRTGGQASPLFCPRFVASGGFILVVPASRSPAAIRHGASPAPVVARIRRVLVPSSSSPPAAATGPAAGKTLDSIEYFTASKQEDVTTVEAPRGVAVAIAASTRFALIAPSQVQGRAPSPPGRASTADKTETYAKEPGVTLKLGPSTGHVVPQAAAGMQAQAEALRVSCARQARVLALGPLLKAIVNGSRAVLDRWVSAAATESQVAAGTRAPGPEDAAARRGSSSIPRLPPPRGLVVVGPPEAGAQAASALLAAAAHARRLAAAAAASRARGPAGSAALAVAPPAVSLRRVDCRGMAALPFSGYAEAAIAAACSSAQRAGNYGVPVVLLLDRLDVLLGAAVGGGDAGGGGEPGDGVGADAARVSRVTSAVTGALDGVLSVGRNREEHQHQRLHQHLHQQDSQDLVSGDALEAEGPGTRQGSASVGQNKSLEELAGLVPPSHSSHDGTQRQNQPVPLVPLVIATASSQSSIPASLRGVGRLDCVIEADPPSGEVLEEAVRTMMREVGQGTIGSQGEGGVSASAPLARKLAGYMPGDLVSMRRRVLEEMGMQRGRSNARAATAPDERPMHRSAPDAAGTTASSEGASGIGTKDNAYSAISSGNVSPFGSAIPAAGGSSLDSYSPVSAPPTPGPTDIEHCLQVALARTRPTALRELAALRPDTKWEDVHGQRVAKEALLEAVEWPSRHAGALRAMGVDPPGGVLLYGPPGCSKTMLARAVATRVGASFLSVKGGELLSKYVGDSEKAVARLFAAARRASPCVVFLDEVDALAPKRGSGGGGGGGASVRDRVVNQLLMEMDGAGGRGGVSVVAATNRPDLLDDALVRPGRLDRHVLVGPPSGKARQAIIRAGLGKALTAGGARKPDWVRLQALTDGFSGAECAAVGKGAVMRALGRAIKGREGQGRAIKGREGQGGGIEGREGPAGGIEGRGRRVTAGDSGQGELGAEDRQCGEFIGEIKRSDVMVSQADLEAAAGDISPQISERLLAFYRDYRTART